jgi:CspA family cold shock protein
MAFLNLDLSTIRITIPGKIGRIAPYSSWQDQSIHEKQETPLIAKTKTMKKGILKFFNQAKGFGFIRSEGGEDIFVHLSSLIDNARENDSVIFEIQNNPMGPKAINVTLDK